MEKNTYNISNTLEVAKAVLEASKLAKEMGFSRGQQSIIGTIVSELGKNIIFHAVKGYIQLHCITKENKKGIQIIASDAGPGIEDIGKAMQDNFSTKGTLGLGLAAIKRMSDELNIETKVRQGTTITAYKWLNS